MQTKPIKNPNIMAQKIISFKEFRQVKDSLPKGSTQRLADRLGMDAQTVRNYFGGADYDEGKSAGVHFEQGGGGVVMVNDDKIFEEAKKLLAESRV